MVRYISEFEHIKSRKDFFVALDEALKRTRELGSIGAPDPSMGSILRQLEAVKGWTANDRQPTLAERKSLTAGRILVREFEPAPTDEIYDWVTLVREVTGYFSDWLDDATFATIDTDDMDDFD